MCAAGSSNSSLTSYKQVEQRPAAQAEQQVLHIVLLGRHASGGAAMCWVARVWSCCAANIQQLLQCVDGQGSRKLL
jgi:hypothetical protein